MGLEAMRKLFETGEYVPRTAFLQPPNEDQMWIGLSPEVTNFIEIVTNDSIEMSFADLFGRRWCDHAEILAAYDKLDDEQRAGALGFFTFWLHEYTHHLDFMTTPYGANFHIQSYWTVYGLQWFAQQLDRCPTLDFNGRLVDFMPPEECSAGIEGLREAWEDLRGKIYFWEYLRGRKNVRSNTKPYLDGTHSFYLYDADYDLLLVRNQMLTLAPSGQSDWYVRPDTLLEARALLRSLRWIMYQFGYEENTAEVPVNLTDELYIKNEVFRYFSAFYSQQNVNLDYSFVMNVLAKHYGHESFDKLIAQTPAYVLYSHVILLDGFCWYALQAPPPLPYPEGKAVNESPVVRLFVALKMIPELSRNYSGRQNLSVVQLLMELDASEKAQELGLAPIDTNLATTLKAIKQAQQSNARTPINPIPKKHFDRVFSVQEHQIAKRLREEDGYNSFYGLWSNGDIITSWSDRRDSEQQMADLFYCLPDEKVARWFTERTDLLFHQKQNRSFRQSLNGLLFSWYEAKKHA